MNTKIIQESDSQKLFAAGAKIIAEHLKSQPENKQVVIALCGGRSITHLLGGLISQIRSLTSQERSLIHFFIVDERLVPLSDANSNFKLLSEKFFDPLIVEGLIEQNQIHPFVPNEEKDDWGVSDYVAELKQFSGKFDLVLLGAGEDGHIAGLFPNHNSINDSAEYFVTFSDSPKPPSGRMSASRKLIERASMAVALVIGKEKQDAFKFYQDSSVSIEQCPLKLIDSLKEAYILRLL